MSKRVLVVLGILVVLAGLYFADQQLGKMVVEKYVPMQDMGTPQVYNSLGDK